VKRSASDVVGWDLGASISIAPRVGNAGLVEPLRSDRSTWSSLVADPAGAELMLLTFHKTLAGCEEGSCGAWQGFITSYTPIIFRILSVYAPSCGEDCQSQVWRESLRGLGADNFQRLRAFDHQSEREFVVGLRAFVLETGSSQLDRLADSKQAPEPTPDIVKGLLKGLPLLHQLVLFLKLAGYSDVTLERILGVTPTVAETGLERLQDKYALVLKREQDASLWPATWMALLRHAWAGKTDACPPMRRFVRILDGQTDWNEKESAEKHVVECLHCLERWAALREVVHWQREAPPLPAHNVDVFLSTVPIESDVEPRRSLLKRLLG
jgi:hypothetical protein